MTIRVPHRPRLIWKPTLAMMKESVHSICVAWLGDRALGTLLTADQT